MAKVTLSIDYDYSFFLLGISCHQPIYKFCWSVNKTLKMGFKRVDDLMIQFKGKAGLIQYLKYEFIDDLAYREYYLLENHSEKSPLIPEHKQMDFFYIIKGNLTPTDCKVELERMRTVPGLLAAVEINAEHLKSKENLIF